MKKLFILTLILIFSIPVFSQQRTAKEIEKMFKNISDQEAYLNGMAFENDFALKTILLSENTPDLNEIEKNLVKKYNKVALSMSMASKPFLCYFVADNDNKRGIVGLDGTVMVPPLSGNIVNVPNGKDFGILLVGEISKNSPLEILQQWAGNGREYDILGLFSAIVVDADKPSIKSLLPLDEYIFLSLGSRGNGKFDIFTLKAVGDDALWGIVDMKGKKILPNEYTGFIRKGHILDTNNTGLWGKWVGTTEMDMTEALNYSKNLKEDTQRRREEIAASLSNFGESLINTATTIETIQNTTSGGSESSAGGGDMSGSLTSQYNKWASLAERHYNSLTNLGAQVKDKKGNDVGGTTGQGMSSSNYTQMKKSLREAQNEMKKIREKAKKEGITIPKSQYEDIEVKY